MYFKYSRYIKFSFPYRGKVYLPVIKMGSKEVVSTRPFTRARDTEGYGKKFAERGNQKRDCVLQAMTA